MIGTIVGLVGRTRSGTIRLDDGSHLVFSAAGVLGEFESLTLGDRVSFDTDRNRSQQTAVRVFREPFTAGVFGTAVGRSPDLRYAGFDQARNVRSYRFDAFSRGQCVRHCVTVDLALLLKHHIGVQEAPALCLRKLGSDLKDKPDSGRHELSDGDLEAFAASRTAALDRKRPHPPANRHGLSPSDLSQQRSKS